MKKLIFAASLFLSTLPSFASEMVAQCSATGGSVMVGREENGLYSATIITNRKFFEYENIQRVSDSAPTTYQSEGFELKIYVAQGQATAFLTASGVTEGAIQLRCIYIQ